MDYWITNYKRCGRKHLWSNLALYSDIPLWKDEDRIGTASVQDDIWDRNLPYSKEDPLPLSHLLCLQPYSEAHKMTTVEYILKVLELLPVQTAHG